MEAWLSTTVPTMGPTGRTNVNDVMAMASHTQTTYPVVSLLLCDDAPPCKSLTNELALCWIQDCRHDTRLLPHVPHQCAL